MEEKYDVINSIRIYNSAGNQLGVTEVRKVLPSMRSVIRETLESGKPQERVQQLGEGEITLIYIPMWLKILEVYRQNGQLKLSIIMVN